MSASSVAAQDSPQQVSPEPLPPSAAETLPAIVVETPTAQKKSAPKKKPAQSAGTTTPSQPTAAEAQAALEKTWMTTGNPTPTQVLGDPPPEYAGGQVATGGQLGMLGNRGVMNTPFNQTSYTAQTIQDQQARSVADVLLNDPSVRATQNASAGYGQDSYFIRGFYYDINEQGLNGLYGLAPAYTTLPNFIERIEVLKGPSALLNGMPPGGAVGGSINLITKQAPDTPITQVTTTYQSDGLFGSQLDYARRFGERKELGVRFNGGYGSGDTAIEHQHNELSDAVLNVDYRGKSLRLSADVGYQANDLTGLQRFMTIAPALPAFASPPNSPPFLPHMDGTVLPPPKAGSNYGVPWSYWNPSQKFAMARGEVDITDNITVYGAYGWSDSYLDYMFTSPAVINADGDWASNPLKGYDSTRTLAGQAGVRATLDTGPVNHLLNVSYSSIDRDSTSSYANGNGPSCFPFPYNLVSPFSTLNICSNIYNPVDVPLPTFGAARMTLTETDLESVAVSDTVSILEDRVQLTVGARRQTAGAKSTNLLTGAETSPSTEASVWSPAYALLVKPLNNVSLYANYIEGLQMGTTVPPVNGAGIPYANAGAVIPPYQTKQKEVGVKVDFGRVSTTLAAFEIEEPTLITTSANAQKLDGEQRNRGIEINVFGEIIPSVRVLGGVAFIDARLTKTEDGINDGHKAQGVADTNVNLGAEWDTPFIPGLTLTGRMIYTSDMYINAANTYAIPDWTRYDLGARYTFDSPWNGKPITLRVNVENVANSSYYASSYTDDGIVTIGAPRTYLLSSTFNF